MQLSIRAMRKRVGVVTTLLAVVTMAGSISCAQSSNQIVPNAGYQGDPTVIWLPELKSYLGARTDGPQNGTSGLTLFGSKRLEDLFLMPRYTIPLAAAGAEAPGLLEWRSPADGKVHLYIDYRDRNDKHQVLANVDVADPFCVRTANCWSIQAVKANPDPSGYPTNPYAFKGRDWSYFSHDDKLWTFYEYQTPGNPSGVWVQQLIDPVNVNYMQPAVQISEAIPPNGSGDNKAEARLWEFRHNHQGGTNEAPVAFSHRRVHGNLSTFVTYSANSYRYGDYDMGLLTFQGTADDRLDDPAKWVKSEYPIFQARDYSTTPGAREWVCNVGSNSVVQSPDGTELWDVYNGKFDCHTEANPKYTGSDPGPFNEPAQLATPNGRTIRVQRIDWDEENGKPLFEQPWIDGELHKRPSGEPDLPSYAFLIPKSGEGSELFDDSYGRLDPQTDTMLSFDAIRNRIFFSTQWITTVGNPGARGGSTGAAGTLTSSSVDGSYFVVAFTGTRVELYGPTGIYTDGAGKTAQQGRVQVYVDGNMKAPIAEDLSQPLPSNCWFNSATSLGQRALSYGSHTLTVLVDGSNPVQLDFVRVSRSP